MGSQTFGFNVTESLSCIMEFNACHDKSIRSFLTCSVCLLVMGHSVGWALERVQIFILIEGLKIEF